MADDTRLEKLLKLACDKVNQHEAGLAAVRAEQYVDERRDRIRFCIPAGTWIGSVPHVFGQSPVIGDFRRGRSTRSLVLTSDQRIPSIPFGSGRVVFEVRDEGTRSLYYLVVDVRDLSVIER